MIYEAGLIALRGRQSQVPGADGYMPGNSPRMSCSAGVVGRFKRLTSLACVLLRSAWLPGWMLSLASNQQCSCLTLCTSLPRAVPFRHEHAGVNPHARTACPVYRLPLFGDGLNPRQTLLITAAGYFAIYVADVIWGGGQGSTPAGMPSYLLCVAIVTGRLPAGCARDVR